MLLNVVQSVEERHPAAEPEAAVQSIARAPPNTPRFAVTVMPFVPETVPVATLPRELVPVQYVACPCVPEPESKEVLQVPEPVMAPVPFPVRQPVSVIAPVPPLATVSGLSSVNVPICPRLEKRFVEDATDEKSAVVVAFVVVELLASKFTKCDVDDACRPTLNQTGVVVETARAP